MKKQHNVHVQLFPFIIYPMIVNEKATYVHI